MKYYKIRFEFIKSKKTQNDISHLKGGSTLAILPILTNNLCHNFLKVRVMSLKVYIFGKEIN